MDVNSTYAYLLVCEHFVATSALVERNGNVVGFVSGYRKPSDPQVLFVWQAAVAQEARGRGLGQTMIRAIWARPESRGIVFVEATVGPSNAASRAMFEAFARNANAKIREYPGFDAAAFGEEAHEAERLVRIGPLDGTRIGVTAHIRVGQDP